jgi:glucose-6-phosphate 1-dehydrogenase
MQLRPVDMRFSYHQSFDAPSPDAYETLLWDVMKGDATLFMRADQVEAAWQWLMPVLGSVAGNLAQRFSQLRRWHVGTGGRAATAGPRSQLATADFIGGSSQNKAEP